MRIWKPDYQTFTRISHKIFYKMQRKIGDFEGFQEITDSFNEMYEELEKLKKKFETVQLDLQGSKAR